MATWHEVRPAYGRDYTTQKQVKEAWKSGADFQDCMTGQYLNKQDAATYLPGDKILARYAGLTKVVQVQ